MHDIKENHGVRSSHLTLFQLNVKYEDLTPTIRYIFWGAN